ncbi:U5 small nuclear ribonucleoprotein TSSC4 isoform 1-T2 [Pholidichthys leucotaenia]
MCDQRRTTDHSLGANDEELDELSLSDESEPEEQQPSKIPFDQELDHSDDDSDGGREICAPATGAPSSFSLSGGSSAFSDRSHSIFDCLDSVERWQNQDRANAEPASSHPPSFSATPQKKRGVPDYLVHPERWTRYSLEDVAETSEEDNRKAAHHFLSSLQQVSQSERSCDIQQRMIFTRPKRSPKVPPADQLRRGKVRGMHLSHLSEEDEDGRDGEKVGGKRAKQTTEDGEKNEEKEKAGPSEDTQLHEDEKVEECKAHFNAVRCMKGKNYRKSSGCEDV